LPVTPTRRKRLMSARESSEAYALSSTSACRLWPFSTVVAGRWFGRYWGKSRHCGIGSKATRMTHSSHRGGFQFALQQTLGRFIRPFGAGPDECSPGAISGCYCRGVEPVKPEPGEPTMLLLP
jgi:hypothetical protein